MFKMQAFVFNQKLATKMKPIFNVINQCHMAERKIRIKIAEVFEPSAQAFQVSIQCNALQ